jgi:SRSO17 transposase
MERRFEIRKRELLAECKVDPAEFQGALRRLEKFAEPFLSWLTRREQRGYARTYLAGLVSNVDAKNVESIAYLHDQERHRLQAFVGQSSWEHQPLLDELAIQVAREIGESDAVLVFDPSGFHKSGTHSVGVQRQWCGRLGKIDNCQVGVYLGYVSRVEQALVNVRLYLPEEWAKDQHRRKKCGVPTKIRFRTRHELALEMLDEQGSLLPHGWIAGDDEMGRSTGFRRALAVRNERYLLAVPSNTTIRDLCAAVPEGKHVRPFEQVRAWAAALPEEAWTRIDVRDAHHGPLIAELATTRVVAKTDRKRIGPEEVLVVMRVKEASGTMKYDYHLSSAAADTPIEEFARVVKAEHRIEECIQRGKSEAGLADYEVRSWAGWHHHQTLSLIATWFLVQEARRGKKIDTCHDGAAGPFDLSPDDRSLPWLPRNGTVRAEFGTSYDAHGDGPMAPLEEPQLIAALAP